MIKIKVLICATSLICVLAATSGTASAFFEATTAGATSGPIVKFPMTTTLAAENGGNSIVITCESTATTKATGFWTIQTSEETVTEITKGVTEQKQPPTKIGPHGTVTVQKWGSCTAVVGESKLVAEVGECRFQAAQPAKNVKAEQTASASIQTNCVVKIPTAACTITWPQLTLNHLIQLIRLTPSIGGIILQWLMRLFTWKATAGCVGISGEHTGGGISTGKEGSEGIEVAGQKLI